MKIVVCLKQVPDTADLRIDPETNTLIREGVESVLNPLDEFPLEAALRLRDNLGAQVTAITMGPPQAAAVLRKALAMGADEALLLSDRAFAGADTWATSLTLARAVAKIGDVDLVLCGKQAIDGDTAQVGPGIAAHLNIGQATYVTRVIELAAATVTVERLLDHGTATQRLALPAVITVLKEANEPRLPGLGQRIRALNATIPVWGASDLDLPADSVGLEGSPTRVIRIAAPESGRRHLRIAGEPSDCAAATIDAIDKALATGG